MGPGEKGRGDREQPWGSRVGMGLPSMPRGHQKAGFALSPFSPQRQGKISPGVWEMWLSEGGECWDTWR